MNDHFIRACFGRLVSALSLSFVATAIVAAPLHATSDHSAPKPPFASIEVLGDSLSDTGRTFRTIGVPPPPYVGGRFSDGPLWIEQLAPKLALRYDPLSNFAWAGANTGRLNVFPGLPGMSDELDELLAASPRRLDKKALYVVFGGANDFLRILAGGEDPMVVIPEAVTNLVRIVTKLHAAGADTIVVIDLPDIGLTPRARAGGPVVAMGASYLSVQFNQLLDGALNGLDFPVIRASAFRLLRDMASRPSVYGLADVTTPAIFNPSAAATSLFWDDIHPTTYAHHFLSEMVFDALADAGTLKQFLKHEDREQGGGQSLSTRR